MGNLFLDPEKNETFELGAKWDLLDGALGIRTAVFRTYKNNARTTDPVLGIQVTDGKQRVQGAELEVVGRVRPGWNLWLSYAYLDSRVLDSMDIQNGVPVQGKGLANVPEHSASLWTTYDITPNGRWAGARCSARRRTTPACRPPRRGSTCWAATSAWTASSCRVPAI